MLLIAVDTMQGSLTSQSSFASIADAADGDPMVDQVSCAVVSLFSRRVTACVFVAVGAGL